MRPEDYEAVQQDGPAPAAELEQPQVVPLEVFVAVDEAGANALVGEADAALIPEGGDVMIYGDGGAGKTTLSVDLGFHLAAADEWLCILIGAAQRVLIVENEGPRPFFRGKLRRKHASWKGSPTEGRLHVWQHPWGAASFAGEQGRQLLADEIMANEIDVVIIGPITASGMDLPGTIQEARQFMALVGDVRDRSGRSVTFVLLHHENRGGKVSGAFEGVVDTLLHVQGQGHGHTRVFVQKARWDSQRHGTTIRLAWAAGESYAVEVAESDEDLTDRMVALIAADPGTAWKPIEKAIEGAGNDRLVAIRDRLLERGELVNVIKVDGELRAANRVLERKAACLYVGTDPTIQQLARDPGPVAGQPLAPGPPGGEWGGKATGPWPAPIRATGPGPASHPFDAEDSTQQIPGQLTVDEVLNGGDEAGE